ncbi:SURP and G-patch domain-containing protein 1 [Coemansia guatemalensis]|uniref:SURP and G-patch domain-containing protein 1 n=1 Tax=Coemansia guatemalensis TaxID=2761395 RepID=A0A9W8HVR1_9FUNG|nr:SURP and G-patch domain-containing protein 1 [Coemansia guatemalensis]
MRPELTAEERAVIDKMAEAQVRNPELVKMVRQSQIENPKYRFLFEDSPLHPFFQWRIRELQNESTHHSNTQAPLSADRPPLPRPPRPPQMPPLQSSHRPPRPPSIPGIQHCSDPHRPPILSPAQPGPPGHWARLHPLPIPPELTGTSAPQPAATPQDDLSSRNYSDTLAAADPESRCTPRQYFALPAGIMIKAIDGDYQSYSPLCTEELEDPGFLESIVPGLSTCAEGMVSPEMTEELEQALDYFEKGVRYIYSEEEFGNHDHQSKSAGVTGNHEDAKAMPIDREGWEPGVLEKVLWDRRKSSAARRKWRRRQERQERRLAGESVSESSGSSHSDSGSSSSSSYGTSDSESDSSSSSSSASSSGSRAGTSARPTNMNRAIGSENVGFKLLSKLGWQQGQGLGASSEGIIEPIRPPTRFSSVRTTPRGGARRRGRGRGRGKRAMRASLGTGRTEDDVLDELASADGKGAGAAVNDEGDDQFEAYRKQMSSAYKQTTATQQRLRDTPPKK